MYKKYCNTHFNFFYYLFFFIFCILYGIFAIYTEFKIINLIIFILWELACLVIFYFIIERTYFIANETYEISTYTPYEIQFPNNYKEEKQFYALIIPKEKIKRLEPLNPINVLKDKDQLYEWKRNQYKSSVINLLMCTREYEKDCVFHKEYLPLDLFKVFINQL